MDVNDERILKERMDRLNNVYKKLYFEGKVKYKKDFAKLLERDKSNVSQAMNGNPDYLTEEFLENVAEKIDIVDLEYLLNGYNMDDAEEGGVKYTGDTRPRIPMNASAGAINMALEGIKIEDCEQIPVVKSFSKYDYTVLVRGDSMEPEFHSGDEVACLALKNGDFIQWGKFHVLDTNQGILIKRIFDNGDYIICRSEERELFPDFKIHKSEVYNIGLAVGMLRRF